MTGIGTVNMAWNFPLSKTGGGVEAIVRIDIQQEFLDSRNSFQFHDKRKRSGLSGNCLVKSYTMTRHEMLGTKCRQYTDTTSR